MYVHYVLCTKVSTMWYVVSRYRDMCVHMYYMYSGRYTMYIYVCMCHLFSKKKLLARTILYLSKTQTTLCIFQLAGWCSEPVGPPQVATYWSCLEHPCRLKKESWWSILECGGAAPEIFHRLNDPSLDHDTRLCESQNSTPNTARWCPAKDIIAPFDTHLKSHSFTSPSEEHDANVVHGASEGIAQSEAALSCACQRYAGTLDVAWRGSTMATEPSDNAADMKVCVPAPPSVPPYT